MFRFLAKRSARTRLDELERFLEFWYGPRQAAYGEPEARLRARPLPYPLRRFYAFAGRWPSPRPLYPGDTFYEGHGGHHLLPPDGVEVLPRGRLKFFRESQGDWHGLTLVDGDDPAVWIEGALGEGRRGTAEVAGSLSRFLVTHCLMTTLYDDANAPCVGWGDPLASDGSLAAWFRRERSAAVRIWAADHHPCSWYAGSFFLLHGCVLVHEVAGVPHRFGALHPAGVDLLGRQLRSAASGPVSRPSVRAV